MVWGEMWGRNKERECKAGAGAWPRRRGGPSWCLARPRTGCRVQGGVGGRAAAHLENAKKSGRESKPASMPHRGQGVVAPSKTPKRRGVWAPLPLHPPTTHRSNRPPTNLRFGRPGCCLWHPSTLTTPTHSPPSFVPFHTRLRQVTRNPKPNPKTSHTQPPCSAPFASSRPWPPQPPLLHQGPSPCPGTASSSKGRRPRP